MRTSAPVIDVPFSRVIAGVVCSAAILVGLALPSSQVKAEAAETSPRKPTIVLVHGAFAESSSWNGVISRLAARGFPVVAVANPLRGVHVDSVYLASVLDTIPGPIVLVGHSYGGEVITNAGTGKANVKALVYVSGLATEQGETAGALVGKFPGSTLGPTLAPPTVLADGSKDLYILQSKFHAQFAADVPAREAAQMAATQRPILAAAFDEPSGEPAWKTIPSWFIYGSLDRNIPPVAQPFMAQRAGAKGIVKVDGASHVVMISHPDAVARLIEQASAATAK